MNMNEHVKSCVLYTYTSILDSKLFAIRFFSKPQSLRTLKVQLSDMLPRYKNKSDSIHVREVFTLIVLLKLVL